MAKYKTMRAAFHEGKTSQEEELQRRLSLPTTYQLGISLGDDPAFFTMTPEVYELLLETLRLDKKIALLSASLPKRVVSDYTESMLIDEIVRTNNIEGVHSSHREISEVLEKLKEKDRNCRFYGLVQKYSMLSSGQYVPLDTCHDIRVLYDELVLEEVMEEKKGNAPDGLLFRAGTVDVCDGLGKTVHAGVHPEGNIIRLLGKSLAILHDDGLDAIIRAALFHYLFGYIHPFYDGNGRVNRFISSYIIAREYEPVAGLRLSYAIKENVGKYYGAFSTCEHVLNRGDLTPFIISFCELVIAAMKDVEESLRARGGKEPAKMVRKDILIACVAC